MRPRAQVRGAAGSRGSPGCGHEQPVSSPTSRPFVCGCEGGGGGGGSAAGGGGRGATPNDDDVWPRAGGRELCVGRGGRKPWARGGRAGGWGRRDAADGRESAGSARRAWRSPALAFARRGGARRACRGATPARRGASGKKAAPRRPRTPTGREVAPPRWTRRSSGCRAASPRTSSATDPGRWCCPRSSPARCGRAAAEAAEDDAALHGDHVLKVRLRLLEAHLLDGHGGLAHVLEVNAEIRAARLRGLLRGPLAGVLSRHLAERAVDGSCPRARSGKGGRSEREVVLLGLASTTLTDHNLSFSRVFPIPLSSPPVFVFPAGEAQQARRVRSSRALLPAPIVPVRSLTASRPHQARWRRRWRPRRCFARCSSSTMRAGCPIWRSRTSAPRSRGAARRSSTSSRSRRAARKIAPRCEGCAWTCADNR